MPDQQSHLSFLGIRSVVGLAGWEFALYRGVERSRAKLCFSQEAERLAVVRAEGNHVDFSQAAPAIPVAIECPHETETVPSGYLGR